MDVLFETRFLFWWWESTHFGTVSPVCKFRPCTKEIVMGHRDSSVWSQMLQHLMTCGFLPIPSAQVLNSSLSSQGDRHEINRCYSPKPTCFDMDVWLYSTKKVEQDQTTNRGGRWRTCPVKRTDSATPGYNLQVCCHNLQLDQHGQPTRVFGTSTRAEPVRS
jgi:hypothetical protein